MVLDDALIIDMIDGYIVKYDHKTYIVSSIYDSRVRIGIIWNNYIIYPSGYLTSPWKITIFNR